MRGTQSRVKYPGSCATTSAVIRNIVSHHHRRHSKRGGRSQWPMSFWQRLDTQNEQAEPMKTPKPIVISTLLFLSGLEITSAQGTAFTYQGRLAEGSSLASGIYDFRFTIYDSTNNPGS